MNEIKQLEAKRAELAQKLDDAKKQISEETKGKSESESREIWDVAYQTELFIDYDLLDQAESDLCLHEARSFFLPIPDDDAAWDVSRVTHARYLTMSARYELQRQILLERDREAANRSRDSSFKVSLGGMAISAVAVIISIVALLK